MKKCKWCGLGRTGNIDDCDCEERINCPMAGEIGHRQCGWCEKCDVPMFRCTDPNHIVKEKQCIP